MYHKKLQIPLGLHNYGNTCFLNAVVQSLAHCESFLSTVYKNYLRKTCNSQDCCLCALELTILALKQESSISSVVDTWLHTLVKLFPKFPLKTLVKGKQEDAHEFLTDIIQALSASKDNGHSFLGKLFEASTCGYIECESCRTQHKHVEEIVSVELEVKDPEQEDQHHHHLNFIGNIMNKVFDSHSLKTSLDHYFKLEHLSGDNSYECSVCRKHTNAKKWLKFESLPAILTIQLERFSFGVRGIRKLNTAVSYPLELDVTQFVRNEIKEKTKSQFIYHLVAFVVHLGETADSGHYISYFQNRLDQQWFKADDEVITPIHKEEALDQLPYILFYERLEERHNSAVTIPSDFKPLFESHQFQFNHNAGSEGSSVDHSSDNDRISASRRSSHSNHGNHIDMRVGASHSADSMGQFRQTPSMKFVNGPAHQNHAMALLKTASECCDGDREQAMKLAWTWIVEADALLVEHSSIKIPDHGHHDSSRSHQYSPSPRNSLSQRSDRSMSAGQRHFPTPQRLESSSGRISSLSLSSQGSSKQWECRCCTYVNDNSSIRCSICDSPK